MPETVDPRVGEQLRERELAEYLHERTGQDGELSVRQFPAGSSNLTYLLNLAGEEFVLRRPPFGNTVKTAHDMRREFEVLSKLSDVYPLAPKPLLFCEDESVIGSEFYLMERRRGLIIRGTTTSAGRRGGQIQGTRDGVRRPHVSKGSAGVPETSKSLDRLNTDQAYRLEVCRSFITNLADLHSIDYHAAGLGDLGRPEGYSRRQVEGWTKRYFAAKTDDHAELESAIAWLNANIPTESGTTLVHNDYKFDNVMLDSDDLTRVSAVLDWEMVTVGDPLMDLGTTLGYWMSRDAGPEILSMPFNPRVLMENVSREELAAMYFEAAGLESRGLLFYYVFGTFKIAVIAQQIYARYVNGFTKDPRFARFDEFVAALGRFAVGAIRKGSI